MPPEALLADYPEPMRAIAEVLRGVVRRTVPDAIERVRPGWRLIGYDIPHGRRTRYFCFVWPEPQHVHIGFEYGIHMADPERLLQGEGITRKVRWLTFTEPPITPNAAIERLILEAANVALMSPAERASRIADPELDPT